MSALQPGAPVLGAGEPEALDDAAWAYGEGAWYAVLTPVAAVLLPPEERQRATALWAVADDGARQEALLDALLADGLRELSGFAFVALDGDAVRVHVRGEAAVRCDTAGGAVLVDGRGAATWTERSLDGVRATRVTAGRRPDDEEPDAPAARVVGTALVRASWATHPAALARPAAPPADSAAARSHRGESVARLVVSTGEVVDVDRVVLVGRDPEARPGAAPGQEPGEPRLLRVHSPLHEISSTHLEVRPGSGADLGAAVVTDLGSTNGTILVQPGLPAEDLQPWAPVQLLPGAVLDLGDGLHLQVAGP